MSYQSDRVRLEALLDARLAGEDVVKMLPQPAMKGFSAGREARKITEDERLARIAATYDRFSGED